MTAPVVLAADGWRAGVDPALGGALLSLSHGGRDVLRPAPAMPAGPLDAACFPLVPYANRIAYGRFAHDGIDHEVRRNFGEHPHSLHGVGWQRTWRIVALSEAGTTLAHDHPGDADWPWPYRAKQRVTLSRAGCEIKLSLTNLADAGVPAGLGLHPYFPLESDTRLTACADCVWLADATMLPVEPAPADHFGDWAAGSAIAGHALIDNAYAGWDGVAEIADGAGVVRIAATGARAFHLYRPPGAGYFCVEPVSHLPDALNREGFVVDMLAPGETLSLSMMLSIGT